MKWPWGTPISHEQRTETAKLLMNICQVIVLAILARPFIPELAKNLTFYDNMYGAILVIILFLVAMRLLREDNKK
ncbi:MAG: hypothetical protein ACREHC_01785 [Candidatus Levyibacteriota bacterium]